MTIRDRVLCALSTSLERMTASELATEAECSISTARQALAELEAEGLAEYQPGPRKSKLWAGGLPDILWTGDREQ